VASSEIREPKAVGLHRRRKASVVGRIILMMEPIAVLNGVLEATRTDPVPRRHVEKFIERSMGRRAFK